MKNAFLKTARHTGIALLAAVLTAPALAQDEDAAPAYQVEVIIFRNLDQSRTTPEVAPQAEAPLDQVLEQQLARLGDATATAALPAATAPAWLPVPREALLLDADARRLARTQTYAVVAHLAWVQPAADVALAEPITLEALGAGPAVNGTIRLYRKRYLHLGLDLTLNGTAMPATIVDSRRIRPGRTVYFDQPAFGVLATVSTAPPELAAALADGTLLGN